MIIFYHPKTGEIVLTVEGFANTAEVAAEGYEKLVIDLDHPLEQWARDFENPSHPANPLEHKVKRNKQGHFVGFQKRSLTPPRPKRIVN